MKTASAALLLFATLASTSATTHDLFRRKHTQTHTQTRLGAQTSRQAAAVAATVAIRATVKSLEKALSTAAAKSSISMKAREAVEKVATEAHAGSIPVADLTMAINACSDAADGSTLTDASQTGYPVKKLLEQLQSLETQLGKVKSFCPAGQEFHASTVKITADINLKTECVACATGKLTCQEVGGAAGKRREGAWRGRMYDTRAYSPLVSLLRLPSLLRLSPPLLLPSFSPPSPFLLPAFSPPSPLLLPSFSPPSPRLLPSKK